MRIISSFRDYYDGLASHDKDDKPVFVRKTREEKTEEVPGFPRGTALMPYPPTALNEYLSRFCLGVCGQTFVGYRTDWKVYWSVPEVLAAVETLNFLPSPGQNHWASPDAYPKEKHLKLRETVRKVTKDNPKSKNKAKDWRGAFRFSLAGWEAYMKERRTDPKDTAFLSADAPLLYWVDRNVARESVVVNPNLTELGLTGVMDVYTISQEIEMYLGSQLAKQEDPNHARTNEGVIHSHGFDDKSFRAVAPSEKKARRKAKKEGRRS